IPNSALAAGIFRKPRMAAHRASPAHLSANLQQGSPELATPKLQSEGLRLLAEQAVGRALHAGATDAEAVGFEAEEFYATVRLGQVEQLVESGSHALGLRGFMAESAG